MLFRGDGVPFLLITLLWIGNGHTAGTGNTTSSLVKSCSCRKPCLQKSESSQVISTSSSSQPVYFYDVEEASCVELDSSSPCVANVTCVFNSQADCVANCGVAASKEAEEGGGGAKIGGCGGIKGGCCSDGSPRPESGKCSEEVDRAEAAPPQHSSSSGVVRWDLVATGVSVLVLLVAVLSVSGVLAYQYKERQKERLRSRYIHNVLEMYESEDTESEVSDVGGPPAAVTSHNKELFVKT